MGPEIEIIKTWSGWYSDSKVLAAGVTALHLGGMLLGGGFAIATDRTILRALKRPLPLEPQLAELASIHRPVMIGLGVTFGSGLLMLVADLEHFLTAPVFWVKMGVLVLLIGNGWRLRQTARCLETGPTDPIRWRGRLRSAVIASLALWFLALGLGAALPSF